MTTTETDTLVDELRTACLEGGLDIVKPFDTRSWTDAANPLPDVGIDAALGVLVGNTRALWPFVRGACARGVGHSVDAHVEDVVTRAARRTCGAQPHAIVWSHRHRPPFPMQRLAAAVGLATVSPSHLAIHPDHGPWWALRAAVVIGVSGRDIVSPVAFDVCAACDKPCLEPFEAARRTSDPRAWLAVRDACPVGRDQRYDDEQVRYHYRRAFDEPAR